MVRKIHGETPLKARKDSPSQRRARVLAECLDRVNAGETVDVDKIRAEHPDLEPGLGEALQGILGPTWGEQRPPLERIGDYRLLRRVGHGGMGVVYEAWQDSMERRVAVKTLPENLLSDSTAVARFKREGRVLSRFDHPGICTVFETGAEKGIPYIAMRYIEGETLSTTIARARTTNSTCVPLSTGEYGEGATSEDGSGAGSSDSTLSGRGGQRAQGARGDLMGILRLNERVARALHVAHEAGFVHRDIKPSNIMITRQGDPVLLDFGLARSRDDDATAVSRTGELLGTLEYMAPEQVSSPRKAPKKSQIDSRADIYSLGVTLYECVTLRRPFYAVTTDGLLRKIRYSDPPNPRHINRQVSRDLKIVLEAALEKDPDRRYQTALDLANDLRRLQNYEPIKARPTSRVLRVRRWTQRNPVGTTVIAALVLFLATSLGFLLWLNAGWIRSDRLIDRVLRSVEFFNSELRAELAEPKRMIPDAILQRAARLRFGVYTSDEPLDMYEKFDLVLTYLERKSWARPESAVLIDLRIFRSYDRAREALVRGEVDFVRFGPASYILAMEENPNIFLLGIEEKNGNREFQGIIFARKDSGIKKIAQIKGKTFAFGDKNSTIGRWLSQDLLLRHDIRAEDLAGFDYLGNHPAVAKAVLDGRFDVGAVKESTFEKYKDRDVGLEKIASFWVVRKPWVARSGLKTEMPRIVDAITKNLLDLDDQKALSALQVSGFGKVTDVEYKLVREGMKRAREFRVRRDAARERPGKEEPVGSTTGK